MTDNMREVETRYWKTDLETRGGGARRIGGLGVPYNRHSKLLPTGFVEIVETRALAKTLGDHANVVCRMEHHPEWLLATVESGSLRLTNDEQRGLFYEADLPNTTAGNDCYELVKTGRMAYSSMGFVCYQDEFTRNGGLLVRHLVSIQLGEVSPVSVPAYADTSTAIRSLAGQLGEDPDEVMALAQSGELRSLFTRTDQFVSATPGVEPATLETRDSGEPQGDQIGLSSSPDPALMEALAKNRYDAFNMNREGRIALDKAREKYEQRAAAMELDERRQRLIDREFLRLPDLRSLDGRAYYAEPLHACERVALD